MIKNIIVLFLVVSLYGCNNGGVRENVIFDLPASLTTPCAPLNKLNSDTMEALVENIVENSGIYYNCYDKHQAIVKSYNLYKNKLNIKNE